MHICFSTGSSKISNEETNDGDAYEFSKEVGSRLSRLLNSDDIDYIFHTIAIC